MNFGTRLTQLQYGDILTTNVINYQGLDGQIYSGVAASEEKLQDLFVKMNEAGINWVIDSIDTTPDVYGNISFNNVLNKTLYGNDWNFAERVSIYEKLTTLYNIELVVQINLSTPLSILNSAAYLAFINDAVNYMPWVTYWQIGINPEQVDQNNLVLADPAQYANLLRNIYNSVKITNPGINVMGPGIVQSLGDIVPQSQTQISLQSNYMQDWLNYAISANMLYYCDVFTICAYKPNTNVTIQNFDQIITTLTTLFEEKVGKQIPIFVIDQGENSYSSVTNGVVTGSSEDGQAFLDTVELVNSYYAGLPQNNAINNNLTNSATPNFLVFVRELVNKNQFEGTFNANLQPADFHYGLLSLGSNVNIETLVEKPVFLNINFIIANLAPFNSMITVPSTTNDLNLALHSYSFTNEFSSQIAMVLLSNFDISYQVNPTTPIDVLYLNGVSDTISSNSTLQLTQQPIIVLASIVSEIFESFLLKEMFIENTISQLMSLLPSSYNKELTDVNYYKLLRAVAHELGNARGVIQQVKSNAYLSTAQGDALYKNFGALISLPRNSTWDDDTYRFLIGGIVQGLLTGPTLENMVQSINTFTGLNTEIHELYNQNDPFSQQFDATLSINPRFGFVVEILKDLENNTVSQSDLINNTNYVVGIIKPAHTLCYVVVTLNSSEDYQTYYTTNTGIQFPNSDVMSGFEQDSNTTSNTYGWRSQGYVGQFMISSSKIGGPILLGPRYTLYDVPKINFQNQQYEYKSLSSNSPTAFRLGFSLDSGFNYRLGFSTTNPSPLYYPDQIIQNVMPIVVYSGSITLPTDTISEEFDSFNTENFVGDQITPVFTFNVTPVNTVPLTMQEPASEALEVYAELTPFEVHSIAQDPTTMFRLNVTTLSFDIINNKFSMFTNGIIDNGMMFNPEYVELNFVEPQELEVISTLLIESPIPEVIEEITSEYDYGNSEDNGNKFYNEFSFLMTNLTVLNQSPLINLKYEVPNGPTLEFTYDIFKSPSTIHEISTGYGENVNSGELFYTNYSLTSLITIENGVLKYAALSTSNLNQEALSNGTTYSEFQVLKTNNVSSMILNTLQLNVSRLYAGDFDRVTNNMSLVNQDTFIPPTNLIDADYFLTEDNYLEIPGTTFTINLTPLGAAVLGNEQRITDGIVEIDMLTAEDVDVPNVVTDVISSELDNNINEIQFTVPAESLVSSLTTNYNEPKFGFLNQRYSLFTTFTNNTTSYGITNDNNSNILNTLVMSDDVYAVGDGLEMINVAPSGSTPIYYVMIEHQDEVRYINAVSATLSILESINIRGYPFFMLNVATLNTAALIIEEPDVSSAYLTYSDGTVKSLTA